MVGLVYFYWAVAHPIWEYHFQVQVACHLQGHSWEARGGHIFCHFTFDVLHVNSGQGLNVYELVLFCCNQVLTWKAVSP